MEVSSNTSGIIGNAVPVPVASTEAILPPETVEAILKLTVEMFGPTTIEEDQDPEFPAMRWVRFVVYIDGSPKETVARHTAWARAVNARFPGIESVVLAVFPKP
jgi:hypothetical protein